MKGRAGIGRLYLAASKGQSNVTRYLHGCCDSRQKAIMRIQPGYGEEGKGIVRLSDSTLRVTIRSSRRVCSLLQSHTINHLEVDR